DVPVDELSNIDVARHTDQHVRVVLAEPAAHEEVDGLTDGRLGCGDEILVGAHGDPVGRRLGARPRKVHVLTDDHLKCSDERGFQGGDVHLAVSLACVPVADLEQRTGGVNRDIQCGAGDKLLVVEVARVHSRRRAVEPAERGIRRVTDATEEWSQWNVDAVSEVREHLLLVQGNYAHSGVAEVFGQKATFSAECVVRVRNRQIDLLYAHLQHVTRVRPVHIYGAGENVSAGSLVRDLGVDVA